MHLIGLRSTSRFRFYHYKSPSKLLGLFCCMQMRLFSFFEALVFNIIRLIKVVHLK